MLGSSRCLRKLAVGGEQQQPLGVEVEPPDRDHAWKLRRQRLEHRLPPLRVLVAGHEPLRLVVAPQPRRFGLRQRLAVDGDLVGRAHDMGRRLEHRAVDRDPALADPPLSVAPRAEACMRHGLGDAHRLRRLYRRGLRPLTLLPASAQFRPHDERDACRCGEPKQAAHGSRLRRGRGRRHLGRGSHRRRGGERVRRGAGQSRQPHASSSAIRPPTPSSSPSVRLAPGSAASGSSTAISTSRSSLAPCAPRPSPSRGFAGSISARPIRRVAPSSMARASSRQPTCHHAPEIYGGIGEARAAELLKRFFAARR